MDSGKTLPASWYISQPLYNLELRAVFAHCWYLLGPVTRFTAHSTSAFPFEIAGVHLTVTHHGNETFTVINTHTYETVAHYLTPTGLLFTTISSSAPSFEEYFDADLLSLLNRHDFRRLPHRHSLSYRGRFNWKTMVDGYQECLHCQYTHRSFSVKYPPTFYSVTNHGNWSRHIADPSKPDDGLFLYFFPICTLNLYGGGMSSFRVCPGNPELKNPTAAGSKACGGELRDGQSRAFHDESKTDGEDLSDQDGQLVSEGKVGETRMEFDYYFDDGKGGKEGFDEYFAFVRRVAMEDFELCETAQSNLERGVYSQGVLNEVKERGVLHYQNLTRKMVLEQWKKEEEEKANRLALVNSAENVVGGGDEVVASA